MEIVLYHGKTEHVPANFVLEMNDDDDDDIFHTGNTRFVNYYS